LNVITRSCAALGHAPALLLAMLSALCAAPALSVKLETEGGSAWVCSPDCGVMSFPAPRDTAAATPGLLRALPDTEPYTHLWRLGPGTASPPAN
jgi:hypothetical protein